MSVKNSLENKKRRREERASKKSQREAQIKAILDALAFPGGQQNTSEPGEGPE